MKTTRKIGAFSSSKALYVNIPKVLAELLGWKKGHIISFDADTKKKSITLTKE